MTDDEIAERIVKLLKDRYWHCDVNLASASQWLDDAEAYRLAFVDGVRERAAIRRQAKRVRAKVFAALGVYDRREVEK